MNKRLAPYIGCAILAIPAWAIADIDVEISAIYKNETAVFTGEAQTIGIARNALDTSTSRGHFMKFENSLNAFINADLTDNVSAHAQLNFIFDSKALDEPNGIDYRDHLLYSAHDYFKEFYIDTSVSAVDVRLGKQQVVWGTADGIKLLDIVNPTDFREFNQDAFEDSRIPVWMVNADAAIGESGSLQLIVAQNKPNRIPGLNAGGDHGHPFMMKGVDSITGRVNGFMNIAPALSRVAASFTNSASIGGFDTDVDGAGNPTPTALTGFGGLTVDGFAGVTQSVNAPGTMTQSIIAPGACAAAPAAPACVAAAPVPGSILLNNIAQGGINPMTPDSNANGNVTRLVSATYNAAAPDETFEYMPNATFATFNSFAGATGNAGAGFGGASFAGVRANYVRDYPDDENPNAGFRFKKGLDNGLNFSVNYFYHYDANPVVNVNWHDSVTGEQLNTVYATPGDFNGDAFPDFADPTSVATSIGGGYNGGVVSRAGIPRDLSPTAGALPVTVLLRNSAGAYYGGVAPNPMLTVSGNRPELRFTESLNRIHSAGGSFDYGFSFSNTPVVVRGEFLYDKGVKVPVVDKLALGIGDLENGLKPGEADFVKYVVGVDVTVFTNLLISTQFIQFINLDYVDDEAACRTQTGVSFDCSRYTADPATLHLSNGLMRGEEIDNFVSLFFSKPFGEDQLGRVNNITIWEEGGGFWNRLDAEYALTDELTVNGEWNQYFGDDDTTFGQMHESSNVQLGFKFFFE